jgi:alpha-D-ribose 1-methylphosphonate 5-triphosphate synthase subunit PhnI
MEFETTIRYDESELKQVLSVLQTLESRSDADSDLDDRQSAVLEAIQEHRNDGVTLQNIHRLVAERESDLFSEEAANDSWNDEREEVQSVVWNLKRHGLIQNNNRTWYPAV